MPNLTQDQKKAMATAFAIGIVLFLAILYCWFFLPFGKKGIEDKKLQTDKVNADIKKVNAELTTLRELKAEEPHFQELQKTLDEISRRLPPSPEAPGFLMALSEILKATGIRTEKLAPDDVIRFSRFTEIPYSINAIGRYHEFGSFLNLVEENPNRFMRVKTMTIVNDPERPSLHVIDLGISTFMFVE